MYKVKYLIVAILVAFSTMTAQSKSALGIQGVYASSTGDLADIFDSGFGGSASFFYNLNDNLQLSATAGYIKFSFNNDYFNDQLKDAGIDATVDVDATLSVIPIMVGARYFLSSSNFKPYLLADAGIHIMEITSSKVTVSGQEFDAVGSASESKGAFDIGAGFLVNIAPKINLDINGKLNLNGLQVKKEKTVSSGSSTTTESSESSATFFTVSAGVSFEL